MLRPGRVAIPISPHQGQFTATGVVIRPQGEPMPSIRGFTSASKTSHLCQAPPMSKTIATGIK